MQMLPHIDLDKLENLKRLAIIGDTEEIPEIAETNLVSATKAISDLEYVEIHRSPINLGWLSYTKDRLRHLVLSDIRRHDLPRERVKFEHVQVVELLSFGETDHASIASFQRSFDFPGLKYFSVSQRCKQEDLPHVLTLTEFAVKYDLEIFALRLVNEAVLWDDNITPFDISSIYNVIDQRRLIDQRGLATGYPKWCLIHGPVDIPPHHVNTPSFHIEADEFPYRPSLRKGKVGKKRVQEALTTRAIRLCDLDQDKRLSETQETKRFWERHEFSRIVID